jgi:hypothetical protein
LRIGLGFRESGDTTWCLKFLSWHFVNVNKSAIFAPCFPLLPGANQTKIDGVVEAYLRPPPPLELHKNNHYRWRVVFDHWVALYYL